MSGTATHNLFLQVGFTGSFNNAIATWNIVYVATVTLEHYSSISMSLCDWSRVTYGSNTAVISFWVPSAEIILLNAFWIVQIYMYSCIMKSSSKRGLSILLLSEQAPCFPRHENYFDAKDHACTMTYIAGIGTSWLTNLLRKKVKPLLRISITRPEVVAISDGNQQIRQSRFCNLNLDLD